MQCILSLFTIGFDKSIQFLKRHCSIHPVVSLYDCLYFWLSTITIHVALPLEQHLYTNEYCNDKDVNNYNVCSFFKINEITLQRLRSNGL